MTPDAVLRWDASSRRLVGPDGESFTDAQDAKARRYLEQGKVKSAGTGSTILRGWGEPSSTTEDYALDPIPGCRQVRRVRVSTYYDGKGDLLSVEYNCDCQKAQGGKARSPGGCSHALAVHRFRRDAE